MAFSWFGGKKPSYTYDPYGALAPEQKDLFQGLGSYLKSAYSSGGFPQYTGDYTAALTAGEKEAIARNARMSALGETGLQPLLKGEFPEQYFQDAIYKPQMKYWTEDILPVLNESYAGPSGAGYFGGARAGAVAKSARDLTDTLTATRADLANRAIQYPISAIPVANQLATTETSVQAIPRLVQQYGLDKAYEEWVRTRPENATNLQGALNFLNVDSGTWTYDPGQKSNWGNLGSLLGMGAAALAAIPTGGLSLAALPAAASLAGGIGGAIGGMFDNNGTPVMSGINNALASYQNDQYRQQLLNILGGGGGGANRLSDYYNLQRNMQAQKKFTQLTPEIAGGTVGFAPVTQGDAQWRETIDKILAGGPWWTS